MRNLFCVTVLASLALSFTSARSFGDDELAKAAEKALKEAEKALEDVGAAVKKVWDAGDRVKERIFGKHPVVTNHEIDGKYFWILDIRDEDGSRCTNNIKRTKGQWAAPAQRTFKVYFLNVDKQTRDKMKVQGKHDSHLGQDPPRWGQNPVPLGHKGSIELIGEIYEDYFAERDFDAGKLLKDFPNASILVVEDGLDLVKISKRVSDEVLKDK